RRQAGPGSDRGDGERGPSEGVDRVRERDRALADHELDALVRRRDEAHRRRQEQVEAIERSLRLLSIVVPGPPRRVDLRIADLEAALELRAHVLAVALGMLGKESAVHVRRLAHEYRRVGTEERQLDGSRVGEARRRLLDTRTDERIAVLEPGHADPEVAERARSRRLEARREDAHHRLALLDAERHRADVVVARREREAA